MHHRTHPDKRITAPERAPDKGIPSSRASTPDSAPAGRAPGKRAPASLVRLRHPLTFLLIAAITGACSLLGGGRYYMAGSSLILILLLAATFSGFEKRRPAAREVVMIALMTALTAGIHLIFHVTIPAQTGTAMVIIAGAALGPDSGFLIGALSRFVCNFYIGQGSWTPWQMICWGILGYLAGFAFSRIEVEGEIFRKYEDLDEDPGGNPGEIQDRNRGGDPAGERYREGRGFRIFLKPLICMTAALMAALVCYVLWPGKDQTFFGWRVYAFGAAGLAAAVLLQRRRLPVTSLSMAIFTFVTTFVIYGGLINICSMVTSSSLQGGREISLETLRILYISGLPYDLFHAASAAVFIYLFGPAFVKKIERVRIKYGIGRLAARQKYFG